MLIDTHTHVSDTKLAVEMDSVLERAKAADVVYMIDVGYDMISSKAAFLNSKKHANIFSAVGVHPHDSGNVQSGYLDVLAEFLENEKTVALGEIGLDFYRDLSPRDTQRKVFIEQLELAKELDVPVIIHNREADQSVYDVLKEYKSSISVKIMHCYSSSLEMMKEFLKIGCYISLAGPLTYPKAPNLVSVAKEVPIQRLLIETDCPYLPPVPHRGERNEPSYVRYVAEKIASIRGIEFEEIAYHTSRNAIEAFRLKEDIKNQLNNSFDK